MKSQHLLLLLCISHSIISNCVGDEDSYTISVDSMTELIDMESALYNNLFAYVNKLETKLQILRKALSQIRPVLEAAAVEKELYVGNPLKAYALLRHLHNDWVNWVDYIEQPVGLKEVAAMKSQYLPWPEDMEEANYGISVIKKMYNLSSRDMANGLLQGKRHSFQWNSMDCCSLGKYFYNLDNYDEAIEWLQLAVERYNDTDTSVYHILGFDYVELIQLYSSSLMYLARKDEALALVDMALQQKSLDARLQSWRIKLRNRGLVKTKPIPTFSIEPEVMQDVERACRGKFQWISRLHCTYTSSHSAFYLLAPFKMEQILLDPYIVLFYDVVTEEEIEQLKNYARPDFTRAEIISSFKGKQHADSLRTAKLSWLPLSNHLVESILYRLGNMTNLVMDEGEALQVSNYGLGGYFGLHLDFVNSKLSSKLNLTNDPRFATALVYLSDVEGGATVFPVLELAIQPKKGSMLLWQNVLDTIAGDPRTQHAACPVIDGSKWVASKWISANAQIFQRPCTKQGPANWWDNLLERDKVNQRKLISAGPSKFSD